MDGVVPAGEGVLWPGGGGPSAAESAHASCLKVCTVEPVKCSSIARLNRLNHSFAVFSFLQSLEQAQQRRLAVEDTRKQLRQHFCWAANTRIRWVILDGPDGELRLTVGTPGKATKRPRGPKRGTNCFSFPRSGRRRAMQPGQPDQFLQSRTAQASVIRTMPRSH